MFHELAKECADSVIGQQAKSKQPEAWVQVYRALDHGAARNGCEQVRQKSFASEITLFASDFVNQQRHRHDADYNPVAVYTQKEVATMIDEAQKAIASLRSATTADRRAFVALVLFPTKRRR